MMRLHVLSPHEVLEDANNKLSAKITAGKSNDKDIFSLAWKVDELGRLTMPVVQSMWNCSVLLICSLVNQSMELQKILPEE